MNVTQKLNGSTDSVYFNVTGESATNLYSEYTIDYINWLKRQYNEMLEALIMIGTSKIHIPMYGNSEILEACQKGKVTVEKACFPKKWKEIKEILAHKPIERYLCKTCIITDCNDRARFINEEIACTEYIEGVIKKD